MLCVRFLHQLLRRFVEQQERFIVVRQPEIGAQVQRVEIFADQREAERVHGHDLRGVNEIHLTAQVPVLRVCGQRLGQPLQNAGTHFCGSGVCKRDNQKAGDIAGVFFIGQPPEDALHQNGCLSGTGGCGDKRPAATACDGLLLLFGPVHARFSFAIGV